MALRERPESLWINSDHTREGSNNCMSPEEASTLDSSLVLIKPERFAIEIDRNSWTGAKECRSKLDYRGVHYNMSLTDPIARGVFMPKDEGAHNLEDAFLCISLTERYEQDRRCHKLVAAIFRNPPL